MLHIYIYDISRLRVNMNFASWLINSAKQNSVVFLLVLEPLVFLRIGRGLRLSKCGVMLTNNMETTGISQEVIRLLDRLEGWGDFTTPHILYPTRYGYEIKT